jgi:hypothetical protein
MNEIDRLCDKIYCENKNGVFKHFIDVYEENQKITEGTVQTKLNPDYGGIMCLNSDYALSLSNYGSSKKKPFHISTNQLNFWTIVFGMNL